MKVFLDFLYQWNPLFQLVTLIAVIIYVYETWSMASATSKAARASEKSVCEMRLSREEEAKPKVVCYFEHNKTSRHLYDFIIKNYGNSAAFNIRLVFSPQLERHGAGSVQGGLKEKTFKVMAPSYEWRTLWNSFPGSNTSLIPDEFIATVSYDWDNPKKHEAYEVRFDIKTLIGNMWLGEATIEDSLKEIADSVKGILNEGSLREIANTVIIDPLQEIARSVKDIAKALEKQAKAKRH